MYRHGGAANPISNDIIGYGECLILAALKTSLSFKSLNKRTRPSISNCHC